MRPDRAEEASPAPWRTRLRSAARPVLSFAVVVAILWGARSLVDWAEVWAAIVGMSWLEITTLLLAAAWNIATYLLVMVAAMPGLTYREAFLVGQSSTAVARNPVSRAASARLMPSSALAIASIRSAARRFDSRRACRRNVSGVRSSRIAKAAPIVLLSHSLPIAVEKHSNTSPESHFIRSAV